jgi:hypothetical protein
MATVGGLLRQVFSRTEGAFWEVLVPPVITSSFIADIDDRLVWCEGVSNPRLFYGLRT